MVKEMIHLTIDGVAVEVPKDTTILEAARSVGIAVPSLCYLKDLNQIAACRVCVVEIEGIQKLVARVPSRTGIRADDTVKLALDANKIHVFDSETEKIICH